MGDPKFARRKYDTPSHPWQADRIRAENELKRKYGLKNKKEIWKAYSFLSNVRHQARLLQARNRYGDEQAGKETTQLLNHLDRLGILAVGSTLDDVLALEVEAFLARRFQTMTYMKGLAHTPKQARQFIIHGHVSISDRKVTIPGYLVKREEEDFITYHSNSPLMNVQHPMRPQAEPLAEERASQVERTISLKSPEDSTREGDSPHAGSAGGKGGA